MKNIIYNSQCQNLHMDRANQDYMKTVQININSNLASSPYPVLLYRYEHKLGYTPQFWGLWDIAYSSGLYNVKKRGYGYILHNTSGSLQASFYYVVDATYISLYFIFETFSDPIETTSGTKATFTGYLFSNGRNNQDYTV